MKVLYVITQLGIGGAESVLVSMAKKMHNLGHEIKVVSLLNINKQNIERGVDVLILDLKERPFKSIVELRSIIKDFNPDVVHSHCLHANILMRLLRIISPIRRLITTAHNTYEGEGGVMKVFKYSNFLSDCITNVSSDAVKAFEDNSYVVKGQMKVIFNIIEIEKFNYSNDLREKYRSDFNLSPDEKILISIGSMKDAKDYPNLLNAIKFIKNSGTKNFKLFIVGDGDLMESTQRLALDLQLENEVYFLGVRTDVNALLSMADIFVLASKHEGLPTVLIEAAMAKNMIISTDCGGIGDILPNKKHIVEIKNSVSLGKKILEILAMSEVESIKSINSTYQHVSERFDPDTVLEKWISVYLGM